MPSHLAQSALSSGYTHTALGTEQPIYSSCSYCIIFCESRRLTVIYYLWLVFYFTGAGIFVFVGSGVTGTQPNNGLVISNNPGGGFRFRFFCRSDSTTVGIGELLGLDGNPITDDNNFFGFESTTISGEFRIGNVVGSQTALTASEQGVYICRIPLQSGVLREINIGVYPNGFSGELLHALVNYLYYEKHL